MKYITLILVGFNIFAGCSVLTNMGPYESGMQSAHYPPKPAGCDIAFIDSENLSIDFHNRNEAIGNFQTDKPEMTPEMKNEVHGLACKWGGDIVVYTQFDREIITSAGVIGTKSSQVKGVVFRMYRKIDEELLEKRRLASWELMGISESHLKDKVSFDHDCPPEKVTVKRKREDQGSGDYILDVCGVEKKYKRTGSVYSEVGAEITAPAEQNAAADASGEAPQS